MSTCLYDRPSAGLPISPRAVSQLVWNALAVLLLSAGALPARAELHFSEAVANVGVVYAGAPLVHVFAFENQGPETITLLQARASCGCLRPTFVQDSYRPGEKGSIVLEVVTLSQAPG